MIEISELKPEDVGRWVEYESFKGEYKPGRILRWSKQWIWVVYHCDGKWDQYQRYTAAPTMPESLRFALEFTRIA